MKTWKKLSIYCASLALVFCINDAIDYACGPEPDPYDYYVSFFHNNLPGNDNYRSFYYNGDLFLNDDSEQFSEADVNSSEWAAYLGHGVKAKDVNHLMYEMDRAVDSLLVLKNLVASRPLPDSLRKNTFLRALVSGRHNNALAYYRFSESMQSNTSQADRWSPTVKDSVALAKAAAKALNEANRTKDRFLQLRYYYQSQRYYHYAGLFKNASDVYDKHIAAIHSHSHAVYWAMSLRAGEELTRGNKPKAAYLFSKVFELCPERRVQIYLSYLFSHASARDVLKEAKTSHEKAIIYAIEGFHTYPPDIKTVKHVYECDPHSPLVTVMLLREMNKVEESYLTPTLNKNFNPGNEYVWIYNSDDTSVRKYKNYIPVLKAFCQRLADENKCHDAGLGDLGVAYLDWMQQKNADGFAALAHTDSLKLNKRLADEKQLIKLLLLSQKTAQLNKVDEPELLPSLGWLDGKVKQEGLHHHIRGPDSWREYDDNKFYTTSCRDFYKQVLAPAYLKQKDTVKAALAVLKSERLIYTSYYTRLLGSDMPVFWQQNLHSWHIKTIMKWQTDTSRNEYDKKLLSCLNRSDIIRMRFMLGISFLREHNYKEAVKTFTLINRKRLNEKPDDDWDDLRLFADPFDIRLLDYPKVYLSDSLKSYSPLMFAKAMLRLQQKIKSDPKHAANYYFKQAAGLYNTSYYGNSWDYITYNWNYDDIEHKPTYYYDDDYLACINAEKYFLLARAHSKDPEFRAKCTFMAAKCRQKRLVEPSWIGPEKKYDSMLDAYDWGIRHNIYFADLKKNYSHTAYFRQAVDECSYLRDFITGKSAAKSKSAR
jgi:hypothetical protein